MASGHITLLKKKAINARKKNPTETPRKTQQAAVFPDEADVQTFSGLSTSVTCEV